MELKHIVIAVDSFKGSISSMEAGKTAADACRKLLPAARIDIFPLADGGEGTVDALTEGLHGRIVPTTVTGPLQKPVKSRYGLLPDSHSAVIEMADAAGLIATESSEHHDIRTG
mgnify:CR=1 FL=1